MSWTDGYVADIAYTYGYYAELNPLRARLALLNAGRAAPDVISTACELGFGQGVSINIHAAASGTAWWGTDFNPAQVAHARRLATASGAPLHLTDNAFAQYAEREDLPEFDYIGLHGIWSWVSDSNRRHIVNFLTRHLKVGGVVYISYNTLPGWSSFLTMRHLMMQHAERLSGAGESSVARVEKALAFMQRTAKAEAAYCTSHPAVETRLDRMATQDPHYLAHEYFNRDWHPMHFSNLAEWLEPAKLQYACSAHFLDHADSINLSPQHMELLAEVKDTQFRESLRDVLVNQGFRRDYWVKGAASLTPAQRHSELRKERVVLVAPKEAVPKQVSGSLGLADLLPSIHDPVLEVLGDYLPHSLGEIEDRISPVVNFGQMMQAIMLMVGAGYVAPAQRDAQVQSTKPLAMALNAEMRRLSCFTNQSSYLTCPVTGGGLTVGRFQQNFMQAALAGHASPAQWAEFAWKSLDSAGHRVVKAGQTLQDPHDNRVELQRLAEEFQAGLWPVLQKLQMC